jgi:predicted nuclease of predicted toxin-antitoxin system
VKLLLDQNLSYRLVKHLDEFFPGSSQVALLGLDAASDQQIWRYAKDHQYAIVTLDADFHEFSLLWGGPPLVIWLKCGNQPKSVIKEILLSNRQAITQAFSDPEVWCVELYS